MCTHTSLPTQYYKGGTRKNRASLPVAINTAESLQLKDSQALQIKTKIEIEYIKVILLQINSFTKLASLST